MPPCQTCGAETAREEMYGAPDELRCRACAQKSYAPFQIARRTPERKIHTPVTLIAALAAVAATLFYTADPVPVWQGQVWRLFTTVFPHVNILHLVFNLYWMWRFGQVVETWMGTWR